MNLLDLDARWRRFNDPDFRSPLDGRSFSGVFDLGFDHPDDWPYGDRAEGQVEVLEAGADRLSPDLCRLGDRRFLCAVLSLPLRGSDEVFHATVWAEVPAEVFYAYLDHVADADAPAFDGGPAILSNDLPGFEDAPTAGALVPGGPGERPRFAPAEGALAEAVAEGISFDGLLDIYAASGQDIRPHLTRD